MKNSLRMILSLFLLISCKTSPDVESGLSTVSINDLKDKSYSKFELKVLNSKNKNIILDESYKRGSKVNKKIPHGTYDFSLSFIKEDGSYLYKSSFCSQEILKRNTIRLSKPVEKITIAVCNNKKKIAEYEETSELTIDVDVVDDQSSENTSNVSLEADIETFNPYYIKLRNASIQREGSSDPKVVLTTTTELKDDTTIIENIGCNVELIVQLKDSSNNPRGSFIYPEKKWLQMTQNSETNKFQFPEKSVQSSIAEKYGSNHNLEIDYSRKDSDIVSFSCFVLNED